MALLDTVKLYMGISGSSEDPFITALLSAAIATVDKYLGSIVAAASYTEVRSGECTDYLKTWNRPVNSLTSVTFDANTSSPTTVANTEFDYEPDSGVIKFKPQSASWRLFDQGFRNISIVYNAGYSTIPDDIILAYSMVTNSVYKQSGRDVVAKKKVGDVSVEYADLMSPVQINLQDPIFGDVRRLLAPYRNRRL